MCSSTIDTSAHQCVVCLALRINEKPFPRLVHIDFWQCQQAVDLFIELRVIFKTWQSGVLRERHPGVSLIVRHTARPPAHGAAVWDI